MKLKIILLLLLSLTLTPLKAQKALDQLNFKQDFNLPNPVLYKTFDDLSTTLTGESLFQYLHKNTEIKIQLSYTTSKNLMFSLIDNNFCSSGKVGVNAFYSLICVEGSSSEGSFYKENGDQNQDNYIDSDGMNTEHIWPQSFFKENLPMRADLHHLRPTFMHTNNVRAAYPFNYVSNPSYKTSSGAKLGNNYFEPPDEKKGDVARSLFYFVMRYYDRSIRPSNYNDFFISKIKIYMQWNKQDPPDNYEKERNEKIYSYQGNRNPFIDDYTLVDKIGESVFASH